MNVKICFLITTILFCFNISAQQDNSIYSFPQSWLGSYQGILTVVSAEHGMVDSVQVEFQFLPTNKNNCWTYKFIYHSSKYGEIVKDYQLLKPDSLANYNYLLDEKDGIVILNTLIGNALYCSFDVSGSHLTSILRKENSNLFYEIITNRVKPILSAKNTVKENDQIFAVDSYQVFTTQFAKLKKQE